MSSNPYSKYKVSVPLRGDIHTNLISKRRITPWQEQFPSPYGEICLQTRLRGCARFTHRVCFRPLTGRYVYKLDANTFSKLISKMVSVPLRGDMFTNNHVILHARITKMFPSPYGEICLQTTQGTMEELKQIAFPSPYGEICLQTLSSTSHILRGLQDRFAGQTCSRFHPDGNFPKKSRKTL